MDDPNVREAMYASLQQNSAITNLSMNGSRISFTWGEVTNEAT